MTLAPTGLPVEACIPDLIEALSNRHRCVLVAPPGSGKTTLAPLRLLESGLLALNERIIMLEPRKLAARAAARRMAQLLGERVGETVGYQTRDERIIGATTRIEVLTEGVLTRRMQNDPDLPGVGIVIFDEIHERNLPGDLGLALLLHAQRSLGTSQRLVLMSATPDTEQWCAYLADDDVPVPVVASDGSLFPVDIDWWHAPTIRKGQRRDADRLENKVADTVFRALRETEGDILVFLPGIGEIRRAIETTSRIVDATVDLFPLAGALTQDEQDAALSPSRPGHRRIVFSTDIAESSLTVDGVRAVIDSGLARSPRFDPNTGMSKLLLGNVSRASADQRAGRAGRLGPGRAYRLWPQAEHRSRRAQIEPEILQVDLAGLALELAAWGVEVDDLRFLDQPPRATFEQARELLDMLDALDDNGHVTELGRTMLGVPLHPRLAAMVVGAHDTDVWTACLLSALLEDRDVVRTTGGRREDVPEDLAWRIECIDELGTDDRIDRRAAARVRDQARDILRRSGRTATSGSARPNRVGALLLRAYPDRLAVRKTGAGQFQLRTGNAAWVPKESDLADESFIVAADVDGDRKNTRVRLAAAISADDITDLLAEHVTVRNSVTWDRERNDLVQLIEWRLDGMKLREVRQKPAPGPDTTAALIERARSTSLQCLPWGPAAESLVERVRFLNARDPSWPDWSNKALIATLDEWLAPYLAGCVSRTDLDNLDLSVVLRSGLPHDLGPHLDELAPARVTLANGRDMRITYRGDDTPMLSARAQHFYGTNTHPTIVNGAVALVIELLSPADRPIQVTADLPAFWAGSWAEVRKDMAGRYPKHDWPVNPAT
ncbi:MAG: ATP-dependent helicase HrpB [Ilumatobacteraceae bacterium]